MCKAHSIECSRCESGLIVPIILDISKSEINMVYKRHISDFYIIAVLQTCICEWNVSIPCSDDTCISFEKVLFWLVFDHVSSALWLNSQLDQMMKFITHMTQLLKHQSENDFF